MRRREREPAVDAVPAWRDPVVIAAACAALVQAAFIWLPLVPLGIPGEWALNRIEYGPSEWAGLFLGVLFAVPVAATYVWFCRVGDAHPVDTTPTRAFLWTAGLAAAGFAWLWAAQEAGPANFYREGRGPVVLYFPSFSGYFTEARGIEDLAAYLAGYEELMAEGDVLHLGTHPPGLIVLHHALLELYRAGPELTGLTLALRPASVRESEDTLAALTASADMPLTKAELAELWAATLLVQAVVAAAVIPLFRLVRGSAGPTAAWRAACLWPLVPALTIFLPKSDALFPLLGLGTLALWHRPGPPDAPRAAAAGAVFWLGMNLSLAMLPVAVLAALLSVQSVATAGPTERWTMLMKTLLASACAAAAFLALTGLIWLLFDLNLFAVWSWNYRNHAAFYDAYDRTYWKWLLINPWELALAIGLPVTVACLASFRKTLTAWTSPALPVLVVVGLLWLSGKNSGEAARLWLFLMPWLLWAGAEVWEGDRGRLRWRTILPLQMAASLLTSTRVNGFWFGDVTDFTG